MTVVRRRFLVFRVEQWGKYPIARIDLLIVASSACGS